MCGTYAKFGKFYYNTKAIPEQVIMDVSAKALGLDAFDADAFSKNISQIRASNETLTFVFYSGKTIECP